MSGTGLKQISQYSMEYECPQCHIKMILHIGLTGKPTDEHVQCIGCFRQILPLVPCPIVGGPFAVTK